MFAIVKIAGKQQLAEVGKVLKIDSEVESKENKVTISDVLLVSDGKNLKVGKPVVSGANVECEVVETGKAKKVLVSKHHSKKRYRKNVGHRQDQTKLKVVKINEK